MSCEATKALASLNNQHLVSFRVDFDDQQLVNPALYREGIENKGFDLPNQKGARSVFGTRISSATDG